VTHKGKWRGADRVLVEKRGGIVLFKDLGLNGNTILK
jgi:hypothetical protein